MSYLIHEIFRSYLQKIEIIGHIFLKIKQRKFVRYTIAMEKSENFFFVLLCIVEYELVEYELSKK